MILLLLTVVVAVPMAYMAAPYFRRWQRIRWLTSDDPQKRQQGLMYVSALADDDEGVLLGAVGRLVVKDEANFLQIVWALQSAGRWRRAYIPDDAWLRWNGLMADEPDTEAGSLVAHRLADLDDLADDPRMISLLEGLLKRSEADVRYNALCAVAELAESAADRLPYEKMIGEMTGDVEPMIVRHAWLFSHYLGMSIDGAPAWLDEAVESDQRPLEPDEVYDIKAIDALLKSPDSALRDVGCVLAVRGLGEKELEGLIAELLGDEDDGAVWSGAVLGGMTGLQGDLLMRRLDGEADWLNDRMMRIGLWMRGAEDDGDVEPELMLAYPDTPRSTVVMALLHRWGLRGLEAYLNPRGEPADEFVELLEDYGWWRVLNYYLPEGAPRWKPGGDADRRRFQLDMLRDWYLVNRKRLSSGLDHRGIQEE
jgi:hypothetical protein